MLGCEYPHSKTNNKESEPSSVHTPPSVCRRCIFHLQKSWLQGCRRVFLYIPLCLTLSASDFLSAPGRPDYISALVRLENVFTLVISFISCPSIHSPSVSTHLHPSISLSLHQLISAPRQQCAATLAYPLISHLDLSISADLFLPHRCHA